jgi:L-lactate dehydrogenase complex protein LldG
MGARENILDRIRKALREMPPVRPEQREPWRICEPGHPLDRQELIDEFSRRWLLVGGQCHSADSVESLTAILRKILSPMAGGSAAVQDDVTDLFPCLDELLEEIGLAKVSADPLSSAGTVVGISTVFQAMAYSGSLVVTGKRVGQLTASLVPPVHVALVPVDRLVYGFKEVFKAFAEDGWPRGAAFITGPSRTADIELTLVMGVHGPGAVHAVLLDSAVIA